MNTLGFNQKPIGISLLCDLRGKVLELLYDEIGLNDKIRPEQLFITAFDPASREKAANFLVELKLRGVTLDWALSMTIEQHPTLFHFSGGINGDNLFIVGTKIPVTPEQFFNELMKINNEQANNLRGAIKKQVQATRNLDNQDSKLYEELTQLNNELANIQRELIKKNIQLKQQRAQLEHLNQEKNEFLGIVAHDLKNPLSGILGLAELITETGGDITTEELLEYADMIQTSAKNMFLLITNLLDVNAIESGKINLALEIADLYPLVQGIIKNYREPAARKRITIHFEATAVSYPARTDVQTFEQVVDNLLSNAVKYSPHGKNVYVRLLDIDPWIRCEIQDEGQGLSAEEQQKLFSKFTRLSAKPTGGEHSTGLGLFIVKKLVDAIHANVRCHSEVGKGANFIVEFPKD
jgi:signal transduction histidine kinase